ncbi:MAG: YceI family protein [Acidimicrobiales bacterium]
MTRVKDGVRRHPWATLLVVVLLVGAGVAGWAASSLLRPPAPSNVAFVVPQAPQLTPANGDQKVYRIDASRSSVAYRVDEILAGTTHSASGSTKGIAGDVLIDQADPSRSTLGQVVVNVEQLTSDQALRDDRLRHDFLQSADYPLVTLDTTGITGLPDRIVDGTAYPVEVTGDLKVKETTKPVTLKATVTRANGEVKVDATTTVRLADFGVGPISLGPLVKTGETADLTIEAVAVDAAKPVPTQLAGPEAGQIVTTGGPSFKTAVQPVLEQNCASCHNDGGAGSGAWRLETAGDAAKVATGLGLVTKSGYMPPWPASDVGIPLQHDARLSAADLDTIQQWAATGGALDVAADTPVKANPKPEVAQRELRRDEVLPIPEPYQGSPDNVNDYRCFLLDPKITEPSYITGFQFEPDQTAVVHHALAFRTAASQRQRIEDLDAKDPGSGWGCYAGTAGPGGEVSPTGQSRTSTQIMGWAPGHRQRHARRRRHPHGARRLHRRADPLPLPAPGAARPVPLRARAGPRGPARRRRHQDLPRPRRDPVPGRRVGPAVRSGQRHDRAGQAVRAQRRRHRRRPQPAVRHQAVRLRRHDRRRGQRVVQPPRARRRRAVERRGAHAPDR